MQLAIPGPHPTNAPSDADAAAQADAEAAADAAAAAQAEAAAEAAAEAEAAAAAAPACPERSPAEPPEPAAASAPEGADSAARAEGPRGWRWDAAQAPQPQERARDEGLPRKTEARDEDEEPAEDGGLVERLLRSPQAFFQAMDEADLVPITRTLLLTVGAGAGVFGAVVGAYRGGIQVLYAAVKVPLLLVGTLAICMPAFVALARALEVRLRAREVVVVALGACARFALVLAGLAPVLWLLSGWLGYHGVVLAITAACAVAGVGAAALLFRGLARRGGSGALAGLAFVAVFGVVGAQTSWLLRPFLVRPKTTSIPFVRPLEGDLLDSVHRTSRSAAGIYDEPSEPAEPRSP